VPAAILALAAMLAVNSPKAAVPAAVGVVVVAVIMRLAR
jgi:hypothetical protein